VKKVLIHIGASKLQEDSLRLAKEAGLYVVATDIDSDAASKNIADEFHCISGTDIHSLVALAIDINKKNTIVGAYCSNDFGLKAVASINSELNLKGCLEESMEISLNKSLSKIKFLRGKIPTPKGILINIDEVSLCKELEWPLIVKPADSCGSQGVKFVNSSVDLSPAIENARKYSDQVLVEEYFQGVGVDTIGIMRDGVLIPCGIEKRVFSQLPYQYPIFGHTPPDISDKDVKMAYQLTEKAALALEIKNGPVKADFLYNQGKFCLLELTPRFHGDVFTSMLMFESFGRSPILDLFIGMVTGGYPMINKYKTNSGILVLWKALLPKIEGIDYDDVKNRINLNWNLKKMFLDGRKKNIVITRMDNSGTTGFVFIEIEKSEEIQQFINWFSVEFKSEFV